LKNPKKYISSFEEDFSEETRQHFKDHFALSEHEKLHVGMYNKSYIFFTHVILYILIKFSDSSHIVFYGYFFRMLPVYGKFYISDNYICFKSRVMIQNTNVNSQCSF
jgi:hypothetical protein